MLLVRVFTLLVLVLSMGVVQISPIFASTQANTYWVNDRGAASDTNPGDGICQTGLTGVCTLTAAIVESNADGVDSTIKFSLVFKGSNAILGSLPGITANNTTIDASDQWNTINDEPGVELYDMCTPIQLKSDGNMVMGLLLSHTPYQCVENSTGIHISSGSFNIIGGPEEHHRNVFDVMIGVKISGGKHNRIKGNYFGTIDGETTTNWLEKGIELSFGDANIIEDNLIVGADEYGINLWTSSNDNIIQRNNIGTNENHNKKLGNKVGIYIHRGYRNQIGPDNWINSNDQDGLNLQLSDHSVVKNNHFGKGTNFGNGGHGIRAKSSSGSSITDNYFHDNKEHALLLDSGKDIQVRDNTFTDNDKDGIYLKDTINALVEGNIIYNNGGNGIHLYGADQVGALVINNDIGLKNRSLDAGNGGHGVAVEAGAHSNTIGGYGESEGNWIGWNDWMGILLNGSNTHDNTVQGNVIGAPAAWDKKAPNGQHGIGIYNGAHDNSIGTLFVGNFIVGNKWSGIGIDKSDDNTIMFNYIGTDGTDTNWKNNGYGVHIVDSKGNQTIANEIAYNNNGVVVSGSAASGNLISMNSIHDHVSTGIELLNGGNNSIDIPLLTAASCEGPVTGKACPGCQVEIFSDNGNEGRVYEASVVADSSGNFSWSGKPTGPKVTATNTDISNNTSVFALSWGLDPPCNLPPEAKFTYSPGKVYDCTSIDFDASGSSDPEDNNSALMVRWDFDNNNIYETEWSKTKTVSRVLGSTSMDVPSVRTVRMQVKDSNGLTDTITKQINIEGNCYYTQLPLVYK